MTARETQQHFCERTGREFIPMGEGRTEDRMRNVHAWYKELHVED